MQFKNPQVKNYFLLYLFSISVVMGSLVMGYQLVCLSMLQQQITLKNGLSSKQITIYLSLATSALPLGSLISSLLYQKFVEIFGEAKTMKICDLASILVFLTQAITLNINLMIALRFIIGLILGISGTVIPSYLISIAPTSISGKIGSLNQIFITIGIALGYGMGFLLNSDVDDEIRWRIFVSCPIIFCLARLFFLEYVFKFDTLQRHINRNQMGKLEEYLSLFYVSGSMSVSKLIQVKITKQNKQSQNTSSQLTKGHKSRIILSVFLCVVNQFSGINAIMFYANQLFQNISHGDHENAVWMSFYLGIFQIIVTIISGTLLDKFGRKTLMAFGDLLITFALISGYLMINVLEGIDSKWIGVVIFLHIGGFSLSLGPVTILYISQILQDISPYMFLLWVQTLIISLSSNIMITNMGIGFVFLLYGIVAGLGFIYIIIFMKESKGKTRNQIVQLFQGTPSYKDIPSAQQQI